MKVKFNKNEVKNFNEDEIACMKDELTDMVNDLKNGMHQMSYKDAVAYAKRSVVEKWSR